MERHALLLNSAAPSSRTSFNLNAKVAVGEAARKSAREACRSSRQAGGHWARLRAETLRAVAATVVGCDSKHSPQGPKSRQDADATAQGKMRQQDTESALYVMRSLWHGAFSLRAASWRF